MDYFVPGRWSDNVDVNDFINLNKIPFEGDAKFIKVIEGYSSDCFTTVSFNNGIIDNKNKPFNELLKSYEYIENTLKHFDYSEMKFNFPYNGEKKFEYFFNNTSTTSTKNLQDIGLLDSEFGTETPPLYFPDIRQLTLYGLRFLTNEKRKRLKKLDGMFQTDSWVDEKLEKNRELEVLNLLGKQDKSLPLRPTTNIIEIMNSFLSIILHSIEENPSVTFHLPSLINFLDIFIERNINQNLIDEKKALTLIFEFYSKLIFISDILKDHNINFPIIESIFTKDPSKTSFRFLEFLKASGRDDVVKVTVVNDYVCGELMELKLNELISDDFKLKFLNSRLIPENTRPSISHLGFDYVSDEDVILYNKNLNLEKIFYLTLNGGKDLKTNKNIHPVYLKFKDDNIDYDVFIDELKTTTRFILSSFSETNNLTMYLADKYFYHPLRSSFKKQKLMYSFVFSFDRILKLSKLLLSIKENKYKVVRDERGFVVKIVTTSNFEPNEIGVIIDWFSSLLYSEFEKLHFYKEGSFRLFYNINLNFDKDYIPDIEPPISNKFYKFIPNEPVLINCYEDIIVLNECGIYELNT